ncbi:FkbM family methyltransferase [Gloeocapsa sp. PCC 73106]|uniref:FkbM family methyltransferase n=1 Tax=Gloeocapsa sp. PCC 73106 TaxID=102232 RepID=UPI0002AC657B|nr:FkbM family methyltransferase [Gloeocapsa sp. PCC 73106]ELR96285.1 methyltransferase, FkbM family [Gloeocapsa sp. PCC 73106]
MIKKLIKIVIPAPITDFVKKIRWGYGYRSKAKLSKPYYSSNNTLSCTIAYNKFGGYCIPRSSIHRPAAQKILKGDIHEKETIEFMTSKCGQGDIVHAGTFYGDFLPALSAACSPTAKVWAFEPNPESYRCASITIMINNLSNINLINAGLGSTKNFATLVTKDHRGVNLGGGSTIQELNSSEVDRGAITVPIVTLDEILPEDRQVSVIQLDVEGYEKQALAGAMKTIQRCLPIIILETVPEDSWMSENILSLGYSFNGKVLGINKVFEPDHDTALEKKSTQVLKVDKAG